MNLLEHYIKKIKSVESYNEDWTKEFSYNFVKVILIANCYGDEREYIKVFSEKDWENVKKQGYFIA